MSTENVGLFLQSIEGNEDLGARISSEEPDANRWSALAAEEGYEFTEAHFYEFVCMVLDEPDLPRESMMQAFLERYAQADELPDEDLENVAGGGLSWRRPFRFSRSFSNRIQSLGLPKSGITSRTILVTPAGFTK